MNDKKYWVWLTMIFEGGNYRFWQMMGYFESAQEICSELLSENKFINLTDKELSNMKSYSLRNAEELIADCAAKGIGVIAYSEPEYPNQLRFIADPPPVLFYKGNISCLTGTRTITCVGTRKASDYSLSVCGRVCGGLARKGYVIVSGFAMGIDITSHLAAADCGMPTVCVMGCGVDVDYPRENFEYRDRIIQSGGLFISEYPPGTKPNRWNFPRRNRILSALGRAAIIFEASLKSGSLITANLAADQGREVFVIPPADIFSERYGGNKKLIAEGAVPLMDVEDVTGYFKPNSSAAAQVKTDAFAYIIDSSEHTSDISEHSVMNEIIKKENLSLNESYAELVRAAESVENPSDTADLSDVPEGILRDIAELIKREEKVHIDIIAAELKTDSAGLLMKLTELEMLGYIRSCPGRFYEANF